METAIYNDYMQAWWVICQLIKDDFIEGDFYFGYGCSDLANWPGALDQLFMAPKWWHKVPW